MSKIKSRLNIEYIRPTRVRHDGDKTAAHKIHEGNLMHIIEHISLHHGPWKAPREGIGDAAYYCIRQEAAKDVGRHAREESMPSGDRPKGD